MIKVKDKITKLELERNELLSKMIALTSEDLKKVFELEKELVQLKAMFADGIIDIKD